MKTRAIELFGIMACGYGLGSAWCAGQTRLAVIYGLASAAALVLSAIRTSPKEWGWR